MNLKFFVYILGIQMLIAMSSCWTGTINSLFGSKAIEQISKGLNPAILGRIAVGAQMAIDGCAKIFKWERWNCPESSFAHTSEHLPTREKAYTDAILAAGIIYSITRDCSQGVITNCACNPDVKDPLQNLPENRPLIEKDWTWGGCSEDPSFGENLVLNSLKKIESQKSTDAQAFISRHNNRIGREIIRENLLKVCKCHGISGSCGLQTCWMQMPTFTEIARELQRRYDYAVMVSFDETEQGITLGNNARQLDLEPLEGPLITDNLLFLEESPDYCVNNTSAGWPGTQGRICSKIVEMDNIRNGKSRCRNLCKSCGYKVKKHRTKMTKPHCGCIVVGWYEIKCNDCILEESSCV